MTEWTHRCLIVPTEQVEFARLLTATLAGPSGEGMWTTPLSPTGAMPATHWISAGLITTEFASLLPLSNISEGQPAICAHLATEAGVPTTPEQVAALFAACDVTEEDAHVAMERLGLQMAQEDDE